MHVHFLVACVAGELSRAIVDGLNRARLDKAELAPIPYSDKLSREAKASSIGPKDWFSKLICFFKGGQGCSAANPEQGQSRNEGRETVGRGATWEKALASILASTEGKKLAYNRGIWSCSPWAAVGAHYANGRLLLRFDRHGAAARGKFTDRPDPNCPQSNGIHRPAPEPLEPRPVARTVSADPALLKDLMDEVRTLAKPILLIDAKLGRLAAARCQGLEGRSPKAGSWQSEAPCPGCNQPYDVGYCGPKPAREIFEGWILSPARELILNEKAFAKQWAAIGIARTQHCAVVLFRRS